MMKSMFKEKKIENTALVIHFFGKDGTEILEYETFRQFIVNLQEEILKIEFNKLSRGLPNITELDFAKFVLRYSYLDSYDYDT